MLQPGYRQYIQPAHPLLHEVFTPGGERAGALEHALARLQNRFTYQPIRGRAGFDTLREEMEQKPAGESTVINCFDLCCLLVSQLRAAGWSEEQVFVVLCDALGRQRQVYADFHACILLQDGATQLWIEPETLGARPLTGAQILAGFKLHLIFNDRHVYFTTAEKERLVRGEVVGSGRQQILYGTADAELEALASRPALRQLVDACFRTGTMPAPEPDLATAATAHGLLRRTEAGWEPGSRLILVPREPERALRTLIEPALDIYLGIAAATIPTLRAAYERCAAASSFAWSEVCHGVVAGMFIDLAVGAQLGLAADVIRDCGTSVLWVFENVSAANAFGVRWSAPPSNRQGLAQLWHTRVARQPLKVNAEMVGALARHAVGQPVGADRDWLYLRYLKLVRSGAITIPVFGPEDTPRLLAPLQAGAARLVEEAISPALELAAEHPWWQQLHQRGGFRHAALRLVLEYAVDRVIDAGLLAPFPSGADVPLAWGRWLWIEPEGAPSRLVPTSFATAGAEGAAKP